MSNEKDQPQDSPAQDSTDQASKKNDFAETMSINSSYDEFLFPIPTEKGLTLDQLHNLAWFNVHLAFKTESPAISNERVSVVQDLMKVRESFPPGVEDNIIGTNPLVKQLSLFRNEVLMASDKKELQRLRALKGKSNAAKPSTTPDDVLTTSWGQVSPENLVGKRVGIRLLHEYTSTSFLIKAYDPETETHRLVAAFSQENFNDPCDWVDIRHIPAEDLIWYEVPPRFPTRNCSLKPGQTILRATSTAKQKKQT